MYWYTWPWHRKTLYYFCTDAKNNCQPKVIFRNKGLWAYFVTEELPVKALNFSDKGTILQKKNYKKNIQIENTGLIPVQISKIVAKTKWYVSHLYVFNLDVIILPQYCWNTAKNKSIVTILHIWWKLDLKPSTKIHCKRQNRLNCLWFCIQSYLEIWFLTHKPYILLV